MYVLMLLHKEKTMKYYKPKTLSKVSVEDALLEHIKQSEDFKLLVSVIDKDFRPEDVEVDFVLDPSPRDPDIVYDPKTRSWTREPMDIPDNKPRPNLKEDRVSYNDNPLKMRKAIREDYGD
jgi:hypothetical protein